MTVYSHVINLVFPNFIPYTSADIGVITFTYLGIY